MVAMNVWPTDASDGSVATEARWRKMARHWTPSGVCAGVGLEMAPTLAFPNLTVRNGAAWVDGHFCELLSDQVLTATANGLAVVRFDPAANTAELLWRDGVSTPAQSPTGTWELPVAQTVGSALTDRRGPLVGTSTESAVLGLLKMTASSAVVSTPTVVMNLTGIVVPARRRLRVTFGCNAIAGAPGNSGGKVSILENGVAVAEHIIRWDGVGGGNGVLMQAIQTPAAGTYSYAVYISPPAGGTIQVVASATGPAFVLAEAIGIV